MTTSSLSQFSNCIPAFLLLCKLVDKSQGAARFHLILQVIGLLKDAFQKAGLDLYLAPYGVLPTAYECGILEVVPEASSRSALGETSDAGLYEIFQREFGAPGTESFEIARHNFILSSAGYVCSYQ